MATAAFASVAQHVRQSARAEPGGCGARRTVAAAAAMGRKSGGNVTTRRRLRRDAVRPPQQSFDKPAMANDDEWRAVATVAANAAERPPPRTTAEQFESCGSAEDEDVEVDGARDMRKLHELILANTHLALSLAKKYAWSGVSVDDLVQQGMVGLCKACERFDASRGVKFGSYAAHWVRSEIQGARRDDTLIRRPKYINDLVEKVLVAQRDYVAQHLREGSVEELAKFCGLSRAKVEQALRHRSSRVALVDDSLLRETTPWSGEQPEKRMERVLIQEEMERLLREVLTERERDVIRERYDIGSERRHGPVPSSELARRYGVSRVRVRQIELSALRKMRTYCAERYDTWDLLSFAV